MFIPKVNVRINRLETLDFPGRPPDLMSMTKWYGFSSNSQLSYLLFPNG